MTKRQEVSYIIIKEKISFDYIRDCYSIIEDYDIQDSVIIYEIYKEAFKEEIKKYKGKVIKNISDIYSLDDSNKIIIKNFIREKMKYSIDNILTPLINLEFKNTSNINIPGCFTIPSNDQLIIGAVKTSLYSMDIDRVGYVNISIVKKFILSRLKDNTINN